MTACLTAAIGPIAAMLTACHHLSMARLWLLLPLLPQVLGSCSYTYDLKAMVIGGRLAFVVDPKSPRDASCLNEISVIASGEEKAKAAPGDDVSRVGYGTFWYERLGYDRADGFPILYGQRFKGKRAPLGQVIEVVAAKPLRVGIVYEVTTTTGAGGYGGGAFKILPDRTVLNVPSPPMAGVGDPMKLAMAKGS